MRSIRSKNTRPEIQIRRLIHRLGYRFRLHRKDLPGTPDLIFSNIKKIIFVHGCFWHQHSLCREGRIPNSRQEYWIPKLRRNVERDAEHKFKLENLGWSVLTIWECEIESGSVAERNILKFLRSKNTKNIT